MSLKEILKNLKTDPSVDTSIEPTEKLCKELKKFMLSESRKKKPDIAILLNAVLLSEEICNKFNINFSNVITVAEETIDKSIPGDKIARVGINKEKDYLYYLDKQGDISRIKMTRTRQRKGRSKKIAKLGIKKNKSYLYFIDKRGDVSSVKMARGSLKWDKPKIGINLFPYDKNIEQALNLPLDFIRISWFSDMIDKSLELVRQVCEHDMEVCLLISPKDSNNIFTEFKEAIQKVDSYECRFVEIGNELNIAPPTWGPNHYLDPNVYAKIFHQCWSACPKGLDLMTAAPCEANNVHTIMGPQDWEGKMLSALHDLNISPEYFGLHWYWDNQLASKLITMIREFNSSAEILVTECGENEDDEKKVKYIKKHVRRMRWKGISGFAIYQWAKGDKFNIDGCPQYYNWIKHY